MKQSVFNVFRRGSINQFILIHQHFFVPVMVLQSRQKMADEGDMRVFFIFCIHHKPGRMLEIRLQQHFIPGLGIILPVLYRFLIDRAYFPLLQGIVLPILQPIFLFMLTDIQLIFQDDKTRFRQHLLE